jgi:hypothetical protein
MNYEIIEISSENPQPKQSYGIITDHELKTVEDCIKVFIKSHQYEPDAVYWKELKQGKEKYFMVYFVSSKMNFHFPTGN